MVSLELSADLKLSHDASNDVIINRPINDKVSETLNKLSIRDQIKFNFQIEILNAGFRYDDKNYFSFGFYQEIDGISYFPKDPIKLLTDGNGSFLNKSFDFSQIQYKLDALGVLHFGVSREVNEKITVGSKHLSVALQSNLHQIQFA